MHRPGTGARRLPQRRLRVVDLVQGPSRAFEALEGTPGRMARAFPSNQEQNRRYEQSDPAEEEQQAGE